MGDSIFAICVGLISSVTVAVLNNWDKINPSKKIIKELQKSSEEFQQSTKQGMDAMSEQIRTISSAQRTSLQTTILKDCKFVHNAIAAGDIDYSEELKQLIILYREYYFCGYNNQGKRYFHDTIELASEHNPTLVHELMNTYFPEFTCN